MPAADDGSRWRYGACRRVQTAMRGRCRRSLAATRRLGEDRRCGAGSHGPAAPTWTPAVAREAATQRCRGTPDRPTDWRAAYRASAIPAGGPGRHTTRRRRVRLRATTAAAPLTAANPRLRVVSRGNWPNPASLKSRRALAVAGRRASTHEDGARAWVVNPVTRRPAVADRHAGTAASVMPAYVAVLALRCARRPRGRLRIRRAVRDRRATPMRRC